MSRAAPDFYPALAQVPDQTSLLLYSAKQSYDLGPAVTSADVELTIEGPSTQSIGYSDIDSLLLNSGLYDSNSDGKLDSAVRLEDDGVVYRLSDFTVAITVASPAADTTWADGLVAPGDLRSLLG